MPLADLASIAVLSKLGSGWELLTDEIEAPDTGWDVLTATFIRDYGATVRTARQVAAEWPIGLRVVGGENFWVVGRKPACLGGNIWQIEISGHGILQARPIKVLVRNTTETQSKDDISVGPPFWETPITVATANVLESMPTMEISYVLIGQAPPTDRLGRAGAEFQIPPYSIAVRPSVWTYLSTFSMNFPFGWTFTDLTADILSGTDTPASLVTESWTYRHLITP